MKFTATAEHCSGKSVSHACTTGIYEDPANCWQAEIEADTDDQAMVLARASLEAAVDNTPACDCRRHEQPGSEAWWESVAIHLEAENASLPRWNGLIVGRQGDGFALYTQEEWDTDSAADLEADEDGRVLLQGKPTGQQLPAEVMENAIG